MSRITVKPSPKYRAVTVSGQTQVVTTPGARGLPGLPGAPGTPGALTPEASAAVNAAAASAASASSSATSAANAAALVGAPADSAIAAAVGGASLTRTALDARYPKKGDLVRNVRDYGAVGNGVTDDSAAIQAALDVGRGTVYFPPLPSGAQAAYVATGLSPRSGVLLRGERTHSKILHKTGDLFTSPSFVADFSLDRLTIESTATAGDTFVGKYSLGSWRRCSFQQNNPAKHVARVTGWIDMDFQCEVNHVLTATVPTFYATSATGEIAQGTFSRSRFTHSGNYAMRFEGTLGSIPINFTLTNINFEMCNGGAVDLLSCRNFTLDNIGLWDHTVAPHRHMIHVGKSATTGTTSDSITLANVIRDASLEPAAGIMDIKVDAGSAVNVNVVECRHQLGQAFNVDMGSCPGRVVGGKVTGINMAHAGSRVGPFLGARASGRTVLSGRPCSFTTLTSTPAIDPDKWHFMPLTLDRSTALSGLTISLPGAAAFGTAVMSFALYGIDSFTRPTTLVQAFPGSIDLTTGTGERALVFGSTVTLPAGDYFIACAWTGTATTKPLIMSIAGAHPSISASGASATSSAYTQAVSGETAPSPAASTSAPAAGIAIWGIVA